MSTTIPRLHLGPRAFFRWAAGVMAFLLVVELGTAAWAQTSCLHNWHVDRTRNNCWPQPFRSLDAAATQAPFEVMKANGWRLYNTLGSGMFGDQCGLTDAGKMKLEWIITQSPENRRAVFVKKGMTENETAARVESVQIAVSQMIPVGPLPEIQVTDDESPLASGQYQTVINRALINSTPRPRLGAFRGLNTPGSSSSSGSGGGAGGAASGGGGAAPTSGR